MTPANRRVAVAAGGTVLPPLVVIARGLGTRDLLAAVDALAEAGVRAVEVTLDSPDALASLTALAARYGDTIQIGVGTVRTVAAVDQAADAGARFLLSPHLDTDIVGATHRRGLIAVPGAFTPTEIHAAWQAGADVVKVFPLHVAGPPYIRAVREPLADIPMLACGGITAQTGRAYLDAGCVSLGVGLALIDAEAVGAKDWRALTRATRRYLAALEER